LHDLRVTAEVLNSQNHELEEELRKSRDRELDVSRKVSSLDLHVQYTQKEQEVTTTLL
jgi:hypothetical protein